jgi:hypothetical protein
VTTTDLERFTAAERMLAEIESPTDAMNLMDYAEAARVYAVKAKLGIGYVNQATSIKVQAEIRLAECVDAGQANGTIAGHGGDRKSVNPRNPGVETLAALGVKDQRLAEARKMAKRYTAAEIRAIAARGTAEERVIARLALLNGQAVQQSTTNDWYTPAMYIDAARTVMGGIDLDPASCAEANEIVKAGHYATAETDGLSIDWHGRVWLNPPYGRLAGDFIDRLADDFAVGNIDAAIALVNAHCTDTSWFQRLWHHTLCFTNHRINFEAGTADRSGSTHGSVFVYLGPEPGTFAAEFARFGAVVRRWP